LNEGCSLFDDDDDDDDRLSLNHESLLLVCKRQVSDTSVKETKRKYETYGDSLLSLIND
jgi:hypothetical protein